MSEEHIQEGPIIHKLQAGIIPKGRRRGARLTCKKLQKQDDWDDWAASETKQLDQYETQEMFSEPCPLPKNANVLPFLWTYLIKDEVLKRHVVSVMGPHLKVQ